MKDGRHLANGVQASEKVFQSFRLEVTNPGGHSSLPVKDNAIYRLAAGWRGWPQFDFPVRLDEVTRAYFERTAARLRPDRRRDMRAVARGPPDPAAWRASPPQAPLYNSLHAHDLRGHAAGGRARGQRAAADGARDRELPHAARRDARRTCAGRSCGSSRTTRSR